MRWGIIRQRKRISHFEYICSIPAEIFTRSNNLSGGAPTAASSSNFLLDLNQVRFSWKAQHGIVILGNQFERAMVDTRRRTCFTCGSSNLIAVFVRKMIDMHLYGHSRVVCQLLKLCYKPYYHNNGYWLAMNKNKGLITWAGLALLAGLTRVTNIFSKLQKKIWINLSLLLHLN